MQPCTPRDAADNGAGGTANRTTRLEARQARACMLSSGRDAAIPVSPTIALASQRTQARVGRGTRTACHHSAPSFSGHNRADHHHHICQKPCQVNPARRHKPRPQHACAAAQEQPWPALEAGAVGCPPAPECAARQHLEARGRFGRAAPQGRGTHTHREGYTSARPHRARSWCAGICVSNRVPGVWGGAARASHTHRPRRDMQRQTVSR